jgi:hypothetical protein
VRVVRKRKRVELLLLLFIIKVNACFNSIQGEIREGKKRISIIQPTNQPTRSADTLFTY